MPGNKLLPFLRDISQMTAILSFFPLPINTKWHVLGSCLEEWTHAALCQQPGNFRRKLRSGLAYGYQSDSKAKMFRITKPARAKTSHRCSKECTAHRHLNGHRTSLLTVLQTQRWGSRCGRQLLTENRCKRHTNIQFSVLVYASSPRGCRRRWCSGQRVCPGCCWRLRKQHWHQLQELSPQPQRRSRCQEKQPVARGGKRMR